jgi:hypothetical protein
MFPVALCMVEICHRDLSLLAGFASSLTADLTSLQGVRLKEFSKNARGTEKCLQLIG